MSDFRKLLESLDRIVEEVEIKAERRVQDNGRLTNFNINRNDPSKLFTGLRNGGENYSRDDVVKVYYADEERLDLFYSNSDGRGAVEVDSDGNPVEAPQTDAELDADSRDSSTPTATNAGGDQEEPEAEQNPNIVRLEDGGEFDKTDERSRELAAQRADALYQRYRELIGQMNENAPISLRGYLKEHGLDNLLFEELSMEDQRELQRIYRDLQTLIDSGILSRTNAALYRNALEDAPQVARDRAQTQGDRTPRSDPNADRSEPEELPPAAAAASDASGDADATVEPGEGDTSSSLEAFASSGKGGLANDPDEVEAIRELQEYLNELGFDTGTVDGRYGRNTIAGVRAFQEWMGAAVDGDAGPETIGVIIRLRSIRWGQGGSKDFADWRRTMTRMEELIGQAGSNVDESLDKTSIRGILETLRRLDEELSDTDRQALQDIVDELQSAYEDGEFQAALPQRVQQRFANNMRAAQGVLDDTADAAGGDLDQVQQGGEEGEQGGEEGEQGGEAREGTVVTTGVEELPEGYEIRRVSNRHYVLYGPNGEVIARDRQSMANQVPGLVRRAQEHAEEQQAGQAPAAQDTAAGDASGGQPRPTESGQQGDYARAAWDAQFDGYLDPQTGQPLPNGRVPARPDENANYGNDARAWDGTWAETHNPDGTPKQAGAEEPAAGAEEPAAGAEEPAAGGDQSQGAEDDVAAGVAGGGVAAPTAAELVQMPIETPEERTAFFRAFVLNTDLMNQLTAAEQQSLRQLAGEGQ